MPCFLLLGKCGLQAVIRRDADVPCHKDDFSVLVFFQEYMAGLPSRPVGEQWMPRGGPRKICFILYEVLC